MKRIVYSKGIQELDNGIYELKTVLFDIIAQEYVCSVIYYEIVNNYRRRSNEKYDIEMYSFEIRIKIVTPHIKNLIEGKVPKENICSSISNTFNEYLSYALERVNVNWIYMYPKKHIKTLMDRLTSEEVADKLTISEEQVQEISLRAY